MEKGLEVGTVCELLKQKLAPFLLGMLPLRET